MESRDLVSGFFFGVTFFGVSVSRVSGLVSVSKDFGRGLQLFVSRLCIGYFLRSFARSSFKNGLKNVCSKFSRSKRSMAKLSLLLCCLRDGENNLPSSPFKFYTKFNKKCVCSLPMKLLQPLRWCCVDCVIHHERDVREG